jgi:hypothetical protein
MRFPFLPKTLAATALCASLAAPAFAQEALMLMFGSPETRHATVSFSPDKNAADALIVSTVQVGVAGSRLQLAIDRSKSPLLDRILKAEDCKFDDKGSVCSFAIAGGTPEYSAIVDAFKKGLTLHIELTNAGSMEMSEDISLKGFTRAYGKL